MISGSSLNCEILNLKYVWRSNFETIIVIDCWAMNCADDVLVCYLKMMQQEFATIAL